MASSDRNQLKVFIEYKYTPPQAFIAKLNQFLRENKPPNSTIELKWTESANHPRQSASESTLKGYEQGIPRPFIASFDSHDTCPHCLCLPCIVKLPPDFLVGNGPPHLRNQEKRYQLYRKFWRLFNQLGLWTDDRYLQKKRERTTVDDRREIIPICIVTDIRTRYPNPPDVSYTDYQSTFDAQL